MNAPSTAHSRLVDFLGLNCNIVLLLCGIVLIGSGENTAGTLGVARFGLFGLLPVRA